jgi:glycosyltransferase involved in cell wall biosynthesis
MKHPLVSVIVPTKNSEAYLDICLKSIIEQSYTNIEIIVVDNNSTDKTVEVARKYTDKVFNKAPERSTQRNYGAKQSIGDYLYFVDSDFLLHKAIIQEAVSVCLKGYDLVAVHNTSDPSVSVWSKVRKFERDMYKYDTNNIAVRFCSRKAFFAVDGYNEKLIASEDYDLHNRLIRKGFKFAFIEPEEIHLGEPKSLREIFTKHYYYGKSISSYIATNKDKAFTQLSPIRSGFLKNKKAFLKDFKITFLFFIYLFVKYFGAANGLIVSRFRKNV